MDLNCVSYQNDYNTLSSMNALILIDLAEHGYVEDKIFSMHGVHSVRILRTGWQEYLKNKRVTIVY